MRWPKVLHFFYLGGIGLKWDVFFEIMDTGMVENRGMEWICFW